MHASQSEHQGTRPGDSLPPIIIQTHGGSLARWLAWIGWAGFLICGVLLVGSYTAYHEYYDASEGIEERYHSGAKFAESKVAIIEVAGVIMDGDGYVKRQIDRVRRDDGVKAVVLRVNSPGGTVTGSDYMYHHLKKLCEEKEIPLVVSMGSIAASGGYYVAMAVGDQPDSIYAEPTTTTGSIGVIIPHYDLSGLLNRFDVKDDSIASHPRKQMLSMTRPIPEEHREILQRYVNESFERFKEIVKSGRPDFREDDETLTKLATGEVFTASQAQRHGLVDRIGFLEDAVSRACELAGLDQEKTRVIEYHRPPTLLDLAGFPAARSQSLDLNALLELNAPRAWYLATQ